MERESNGNQLILIQWMRWDIPPEASDVLSHSILDQIQAAAIEHLPHAHRCAFGGCCASARALK